MACEIVWPARVAELEEKLNSLTDAQKQHQKRCLGSGNMTTAEELETALHGALLLLDQVDKSELMSNAAAERTMAHNDNFEIEAWDHQRGLADHETREEVQA